MGDPDEGIAMAFAVATLHRHADTLPRFSSNVFP
jgi:hypothetical protein